MHGEKKADLNQFIHFDVMHGNVCLCVVGLLSGLGLLN